MGSLHFCLQVFLGILDGKYLEVNSRKIGAQFGAPMAGTPIHISQSHFKFILVLLRFKLIKQQCIYGITINVFSE